MALYKGEVDERIDRGEINPDEGQRLVGWRQWQLAQQEINDARRAAQDIPAMQSAPSARPQVIQGADYRPYYAPPPVYSYPSPYPPPPTYMAPPLYAAPYPYYVAPWWGPAICAGGWGRHGGARLCF